MVGSTHCSGWGERAGQLHAQNEGAPAGGLAAVPGPVSSNTPTRRGRLPPGPDKRRRASVPSLVRAAGQCKQRNGSVRGVHQQTTFCIFQFCM